MFVRRFTIAMLALAVSTVEFSAAVHAQDASVSYRFSELTTDAGQKALVTRIEHAAARACQSQNQGSSLDDIVASRRCARELTSQMVGKLGIPALSARVAPHDGLQIASR